MPSEAPKPKTVEVARTGPAVSERPDLEAIRARCAHVTKVEFDLYIHEKLASVDVFALLAWVEHLENLRTLLGRAFRDEWDKSQARRAMLGRVQWCIPSTLEDFLCPICQHAEGYHAPDCALTALLTDEV